MSYRWYLACYLMVGDTRDNQIEESFVGWHFSAPSESRDAVSQGEGKWWH